MASMSRVLSIASTQTDNLEEYVPEDLRDFLIDIGIVIDFDGDDWGGSGELFRLVVCTPQKLYEIARRCQPCFMLSGYLVVDQYDWNNIRSMIMSRFNEIIGESTMDLMIEFCGYATYAD